MNQSYMGLNTRSLVPAALIAGVAIGLLSNIPLIACVNCLLFAWVWGGGIGAVYLYRQRENRPYLTIAQGILIGLAAGLVGAVVGGIASLLFGGLTAAFSSTIANLAGDNSRVLPSFLFNAGFSFLRLIGDLFLYGILGAIGGLIATGLIWKAPAAPIAPPPPYTPPPGSV